VRREPTVAAVRTDRRGDRSLFAIGEAARSMLGRTPADLIAVRPLRDGGVHDRDVAEAFLVHLVRQLHGRSRFVAPRLVVATPHHMRPGDLNALRASCAAVGARELRTIARPVAAALGAGLALRADDLHLIVDMGGGSAEVAVLSGRHVLRSRRVPGGDALDRAITSFLAEHHALEVSDEVAEALKRAALGEAMPSRALRVRGRCTQTGLPALRRVASTEVEAVARPFVLAIARATASLVNELSAAQAAEVRGTGALLTGGACQLRGLDDAICDAAGLLVFVADHPEDAVIRGAGLALEADDREALQPC